MFIRVTLLLGDIEQLRDYETIRQRCNIPKLVGIDLIQRVAGHSWSPLLALTNSAFQITNAVPPLKVNYEREL